MGAGCESSLYEGVSPSLVIMPNKEDTSLMKSKTRCDKYDYMVAAGCGAIGGFVDIFLVGSPKDSKLLKWTDKMTDNTVIKFAKLAGWNPKEGKENNVKSAIGYLERKYRVNYDQRTSADVGGKVDLNTKNHHFKNLAHSPDPIGLFFSILNQFTNTSTFIDNGKVITVSTGNYELHGHTFLGKLYCGTVNWLGHLMSDVAGASGASGRGSGLCMPFYQLFGLCNFGSFNINGDRQTLSVLAERAYKEGMDFRFGLTQAIPVLLTDSLIRLVWSIRRYYETRSFREAIPNSRAHSDLRLMLLIGKGCLCTMDLADCLINHKLNALDFFLHLNLTSWFALALGAVKEVIIRLNLPPGCEEYIESYQTLEMELDLAISQLKRIDYEKSKAQVKQFHDYIHVLQSIKSEKELATMTYKFLEESGVEPAYEGALDNFMRDKNARLKL